MAIPIKQSLSGFIVSEPEASTTRNGAQRVHMRIGSESWRRNEDGTFTQEGITYHTLALYDRAALKAYKLFEKGDRFVAEGYVHTYRAEVEGQTRDFEEFVARKIGHDASTTRYRVDRTPTERPGGRAQGPAASAESGAGSGTRSTTSTAGQTEASPDGRQQTLPPQPTAPAQTQHGQPVAM
jgi:single-strand DNA-binding protein